MALKLKHPLKRVNVIHASLFFSRYQADTCMKRAGEEMHSIQEKGVGSF